MRLHFCLRYDFKSVRAFVGLTLNPLVAINADLVCDRDHAGGRTGPPRLVRRPIGEAGLAGAMLAKAVILAKDSAILLNEIQCERRKPPDRFNGGYDGI